MSGIAATLERSGAPAGAARIARMLGRLRRRGPDRAASHVSGPVALAHAMLETTPEDAWDSQPLASRSGRQWIVADIRLDNRREILDQCPDASDAEGETPDAALVLRAYERWGEACPARLVGDFAFVIWDADARRLFCARDPLGARLLYYHHDTTSFRCATEMDVLFADERVPRRPDRRSMALFLAYEYAERDETLYEGVHALPPGHTLTVTAGSVRRAAYWQPDPWRANRPARLDDAAARLAEALAEAVRCRLRAKGRAGAQVSGGLDSSSVACEARRIERAQVAPGPPLMLLRAVFPGLDCDERAYSDAVGAHLGLPITTCTPAAVRDVCPIKVAYPDLYFHPTRTMLDPMLPDLRREGVRVVLTGGGGDMLMQPSGYDGAHHLRRGRLLAFVDEVTRGTFMPSVAALRGLALQAAWALTPGVAARLRASRHPATMRWPWLSRTAAEMVDRHIAADWEQTCRLHPDLLTAELCRGVTHGVGTLLPLALDDRWGALHGVELRRPFFDVRVVETLLSLPVAHRFSRHESKRVLRRAMGRTLPDLVRKRHTKAEFSSYVRRVFLEDQRRGLQRLFTRSRLDELGLTERTAVGQLLDRPPAAQSALGLTNLAAMELWLRAITEHTIPTPFEYEDRHEHG